MPSPTSRASSASTLTALHDWIRASPYRTGFALSVFVALFVASTGASLLSVPAVFLGSLPGTVLLAFAHEVALRRVRGDDAARLRRSDGASRPSSVSVPEDASPDEIDGAMARLRERYAAGEIDEDEFERKVDRLLATESPATARRERRRLRQRRTDRATEPAGEQDAVERS
jgi:hypothetical protein